MTARETLEIVPASGPRTAFSAPVSPAGTGGGSEGGPTPAATHRRPVHSHMAPVPDLSRSARHDDGHMSDDMLRAYLRDYLRSQPDGHVTIEWVGDEPTACGIPFFERAVQLARQCQRPSQDVSHYLRTDGSLLTDEWGRFLSRHRFLVDLQVEGAADQTARGWEILRRFRVTAGILCTVTAENEDRGADVYRHLRDQLGATTIQFTPLVERDPDGHGASSRSVSPEGWGHFLIDAFDEWLLTDVGTVHVQPFDVALGNALGDYTQCTHAPECGSAVAVLANGDIFACRRATDACHARGNLADVSLRDALDSPEQRLHGETKRTGLAPQCRTCDVRWACHGGCPRDRFAPSADGEPAANHLCAGYRAFFTHIQPTITQLVELLRAGHPAASIMAGAAPA